MKIYTKRGDFGQTDLLSKRVSKNDLSIEVNGQLDEVMATILVAKQQIKDQDVLNDLDKIHEIIFQMAFEIALDEKDNYKVFAENVSWLEQNIDLMDLKLEKLTKFIKLDQTLASSWLNMARVKTRTAERVLIELNEHKSLNEQSLKFINRLSDYFFTLGRKYNNE
ncbi:MAG: cob(I)yrinic acid a,c-diamide adenosyltransferase [Acholeplasmataceae bacterium]|nr:cob(I)yrinic acid a,c-diamide adenosyltransferase [Acholeplasmataceae bacterium]